MDKKKKFSDSSSLLKQLQDFLILLFSENFTPNFLIENEMTKDNQTMKHPEMNLFFWALLSCRFETAKIFWKMGEVTNKAQQ